jgi:hypothetical protein
VSRALVLTLDPRAFPSPRARGRVLAHVVDFDGGEAARVPAVTSSVPLPRGARVVVHRDGRGRLRVRLARPGARRVGTYAGLFWVQPAGA